MDRQTIYFAVYVNIGNASTQKAQEMISEFMRLYTAENPLKPKQYEERYFIFPVRDQDTKIEVIFPTPFMTEEQAKALHEKYYERFEDLIAKIDQL